MPKIIYDNKEKIKYVRQYITEKLGGRALRQVLHNRLTSAGRLGTSKDVTEFLHELEEAGELLRDGRSTMYMKPIDNFLDMEVNTVVKMYGYSDHILIQIYNAQKASSNRYSLWLDEQGVVHIKRWS